MNQWTLGRISESGNLAVLLTFLSDQAPVREDNFAGNPARVFPCHKGNDEELWALKRWLSAAGAELGLSLYPLQRHAVHTQFHPLPTQKCVIYLRMTEALISDAFTCQNCGNCPKRLLLSSSFSSISFLSDNFVPSLDLLYLLGGLPVHVGLYGKTVFAKSFVSHVSLRKTSGRDPLS